MCSDVGSFFIELTNTHMQSHTVRAAIKYYFDYHLTINISQLINPDVVEKCDILKIR